MKLFVGCCFDRKKPSLVWLLASGKYERIVFLFSRSPRC